MLDWLKLGIKASGPSVNGSTYNGASGFLEVTILLTI